MKNTKPLVKKRTLAESVVAPKLRFYGLVEIRLIPEVKEYRAAGLSQDLWFSQQELYDKRLEFNREVRVLADQLSVQDPKLSESDARKRAAKMLCSSENDENNPSMQNGSFMS